MSSLFLFIYQVQTGLSFLLNKILLLVYYQPILDKVGKIGILYRMIESIVIKERAIDRQNVFFTK